VLTETRARAALLELATIVSLNFERIEGGQNGEGNGTAPAMSWFCSKG